MHAPDGTMISTKEKMLFFQSGPARHRATRVSPASGRICCCAQPTAWALKLQSKQAAHPLPRGRRRRSSASRHCAPAGAARVRRPLAAPARRAPRPSRPTAS